MCVLFTNPPPHSTIIEDLHAWRISGWVELRASSDRIKHCQLNLCWGRLPIAWDAIDAFTSSEVELDGMIKQIVKRRYGQ